MLYITLRQYEYIVTVADEGTLTKAALALNVSQPSLSVALTQVEDRLGQPIFIRRKGAAIEITPFGHRFVDQARNLLELATRMEQGQAGSRPFVLACFKDIAPWYLAPALDQLAKQFPTMALQGAEGRFAGLADDLAQGRADLAISYDIGFDDRFERQKIKEVLPVAFLSVDHPLAAQPHLALENLVDQPLILFDEDLSEGYVRTMFERLDLRPTVVARAGSLESMRSFAAHGAGIGISYSDPQTDISYDGRSLITRPISSQEAAADVVLVWSRLAAKDAPVRDVVDVISTM